MSLRDFERRLPGFLQSDLAAEEIQFLHKNHPTQSSRWLFPDDFYPSEWCKGK